MEERRLRLGDVLDDYCPHERRLSNHVIVAMVGDEVIKTRCTTCDAEHPYKHARVPARRRKKDIPSTLYKEVLEGLTEQPADAALEGESSGEPGVEPAVAPRPPEHSPDAEAVALSAAPEEPTGLGESLGAESTESETDEGPHHRVTLIRATLPRPEGQPASRQPPEFTMHRMRNGPGNKGRPKIRGGGKSGTWPGGPNPGGKSALGARPPRPRGPGRPSRDGRRSHGPRRSR
ncbi:MAG: hypothetical protein GEU99_21225 [Luteitalea sp.]|nr:hypothetical protein [Luteitalea sp.]